MGKVAPTTRSARSRGDGVAGNRYSELYLTPRLLGVRPFGPPAVLCVTTTSAERCCHLDYTVQLKRWRIWVISIVAMVTALGVLWTINYEQLGMRESGLPSGSLAVLPIVGMALAALLFGCVNAVRLRSYRRVVERMFAPLGMVRCP